MKISIQTKKRLTWKQQAKRIHPLFLPFPALARRPMATARRPPHAAVSQHLLVHWSPQTIFGQGASCLWWMREQGHTAHHRGMQASQACWSCPVLLSYVVWTAGHSQTADKAGLFISYITGLCVPIAACVHTSEGRCSALSYYRHLCFFSADGFVRGGLAESNIADHEVRHFA